MKTFLKTLSLTFVLFSLTMCGGSGSNETPEFPILPSFSPSGSEELDYYVINTFRDYGIDITVTPEKMDFNAEFGEIEIDQEKMISFLLQNNSGETRTFKFNTYAVTPGFVILDELRNNVGAWNEIVLEDGEEKTFHIQFRAYQYGTQMSYLVITADVTGNIYLPFRAKVTGGGANYRLTSTSYLCVEDGPDLQSLDFYKIPTGNEKTMGIKFCNIGGQDVKIYTAKITNGSAEPESEYFTIAAQNGYAGFEINSAAEIDENFGLDLDVNLSNGSYLTTELNADINITTAANDFSIREYSTGERIEDYTVEAGDYLRMNVTFSPSLEIEAPEGSRYEALPENAILTLETSIGAIEIDLLAATAGYEPLLSLSYRFNTDEDWQTVDTLSNVAAIDFGSVNVFLDSVPNNSQIAELKVENSGSASYPLEFHPTDLVGYYEFYSDNGTVPTFPFNLASNESRTFQLRYLPTPFEKENETHWDIGQLRFIHSGANGPEGQVTLIADQSAGYAVELKLNGARLKKDYVENEAKNLCVIQIDDGEATATQKTFSIHNNDPVNTLTADWRFSVTNGNFHAVDEDGSGSGTLTIEPSSSKSITLSFFADASVNDGATLEGVFEVINTLTTPDGQDIDSLYASYLANKESNDFTIPVRAQASSTGECTMTPDIFDDPDGDGIIPITMRRMRTGMVMTDLAESNRNLPENISNLPLEINLNNMTVRLGKDVNVPTSASDLQNPQDVFRSYSHFFNDSTGCPTLPTTPYGSLTGPDGYLEPRGLSCGEVTSSDGQFNVHMGQLTLRDEGPEEYTDANGTLWRVYYHRFGRVNPETCTVQYYGRIANLAMKPDEETLEEVFQDIHADPYEEEYFYENRLGVWKHGSFIKVQESGFQCGTKIYNAGEEITDPDELKECYMYLSTQGSSTRYNGRLDQESYFYFSFKEGDEECDFDNPDTCNGIGPLEKHVDADGNVQDNYYDLTIYNAELNVYVISAGDRSTFLLHASHNIYTKMWITFTTKVLAKESDYNGDYKKLVAPNTREHIDKNQIFLKDGELYNLSNFWTGDHTVINNMSNVVDKNLIPERGVNYGGFGKGAFRKCQDPSKCDIIPAGYPVNTQENNLIVFNGIGAFNLTGKVLPGFAKSDGVKGKPLFFYMGGCLIPGHDIDPTRGCYNWQRDDALMQDETTPIIDEYVDRGMLPNGYPTAAECSSFIDQGLNNPDHEDYDPFYYMACINYQIEEIDRDRQTNYYDKSNPFVYDTNYYGASYCGAGM